MSYRDPINAEFARCCIIARDKWGFPHTISLHYDLRGMAAGKAVVPLYRVRLNDDIAKAEGDAFLPTVAHEVAHCVAFWAAYENHHGADLGSYTPHGALWQRVMRSMGHTPERTHSYASAKPARNTRPFAAFCACSTHLLTRRKADAIARLYCKRCRGRLTLNGPAPSC